MRHRLLLASVFALTLLVLANSASALPFENGMLFPAGSIVIPMDDKQADRILVYGFLEALLSGPNPITLFRVIEPPNVTLATNMTASPTVFAGGPFLARSSDAAKIAQTKSEPDFKRVTISVLTEEQVVNNVLRHGAPTRILIVNGEPPLARTDLVLDAMKVLFNTTTHAALTENPNMIFDYDVVVVDSAGWNGTVPSEIANTLRASVNSGGEVIFTGRALMDLNSTFPGYITISDPQQVDKVASSYFYDPPRKYDPTEYGVSADRFPSEPLGQYYSSLPSPNEINFFVPAGGLYVSSVALGNVNDTRILVDSNDLGPTGDNYGILAFYFKYGTGIVRGLPNPQEQSIDQVGEKGYDAICQLYGNEIGFYPFSLFRSSSYLLGTYPSSITVAQSSLAGYTITVNSLYGFNRTVTLEVTDLPAGTTGTFNPSAVQAPPDGKVQSTFVVMIPTSTPPGTYVMNVTGTDTSTPPINRWVLLGLNVTAASVTTTATSSPPSPVPFIGVPEIIVGIVVGLFAISRRRLRLHRL